MLEGHFFMTCYYDVIILGGNLNGILSSSIIKEKGLSVCYLDSERLLNNFHTSVIDRGINKLLDNPYHTWDYFQISLEAIYKLTDIIKLLDNDCEFTRYPLLSFKAKPLDNNNSLLLPFTNLIYQGGTKVNYQKLMNELLKYCQENNIDVIDNTEIASIEIEVDYILLKTKVKQLTCKKLIISSRSDSKLFFERPKANFYNNISKDNKYNISQNHKKNEVEYFFNQSSYLKTEDLPYISLHEDYHNIFFNIGNDEILTSVIGTILFLEMYECNKGKRIDLFQQIYNP
jgi:hypothetical protein